jgi:Phosphotransferase enzyme family
MADPALAGAWRTYPDGAGMLAGVTERVGFGEAPGKSGARLERVVIDGERYVLKHLDLAEDWTLRASGCLRGAPLVLWERGILARLPACFNQPIVGAAPAPSGGCALLMRDVSAWLVPATDAPITPGQHALFLRHMAALHAEFWDCGPEFDVVPAMHRYLELSPWTAAAERAAGSAHLVPRLIAQGWPLLAEVAPAVAAVVTPLARDPGPLVEALAGTPQTFVHSNWKLDNLGTDNAGRTVLLDWEQPGRGAPLSDLAWYLAINCRRLPQSKEDSIAAYRQELQACGIDTEPWWERQLALSLLGALVQFGWEKALGGYDEELAWWETNAVPAAALLT